MLEILTIIAILVGPIVALRLQRVIDSRKDAKERRLRVFKTLMVTRASVLSPNHVEALNTIDIEFNGNDQKDRKVREAWKEYLDQLGQRVGDNPSEDDNKRWKEKTDELLVNLLHVMSDAVGYSFDRTYIRRTAYLPSHYSTVELELGFIRRSIVDLFLGRNSIPIEIKGSGGPDGEESSEETLRRLLIEHYQDGKPIRVIIAKDEENKSMEGTENG